jgi:DNA-binding transcriptional regulator YhcF (GntR family)
MSPAATTDALDLALDRDADVPIGVQLAWALRARILAGELGAGARLPPLHRLAEALGVNPNTVRSVYQRLEQDGLVATRHGSGTYVRAAPVARGALAQLAASAARTARDAGVDPRDLAAALYVGAREPGQPDAAAAERRRLRAQIAALEQALSDLLVRRPDLAPSPADAAPPPAARLLDAAELEAQRDALVRLLAEVQRASEDAGVGDERSASEGRRARRPSR